MKPTSLFLLLLAGSAVAFTACKKDDPPPVYCTNTISLGFFAPTYTMPYDTFLYQPIVNEAGQEEGLSINHPSNMLFHDVEKEIATNYESNCAALQSADRYTWSVHEKQALVLFPFNGTGYSLLIKETALPEEAHPENEMVGTFLEFYHQRDNGVIASQPLMRLVAEPIQPAKAEGLEFGYEFHETIELAGQTFSDVYTNPAPLQGGIRHFYYNIELGVVGVVDGNGVEWRVVQ